MNGHSANIDNAESVLRTLTLKFSKSKTNDIIIKWIVENATDERLIKLIEIFQNELDRRRAE